jgi:sigma-B regulation protein RsbU (phosphoserine phosphatase)
VSTKKPIRVLIVEDSEFDARILVNTLRQGGYDPAFRRVETAEEMRQALEGETWEIILSDYNLPDFSAPEALRLLQDTELDLPFVIISGGIGEDIAVAAMKAGAHDYLMKGNLARLIPAVEREMREAVTRGSARRAEDALRDSEERNRLLWEHSTDAVIMMDPDGAIRFANPAVERVFGCESSSVVGKDFRGLLVEEERDKFPDWVKACLTRDRGAHPASQSVLTVGCHRLHRDVFLEIALTEVQLKGVDYIGAFIRDITERRLAEQESRLLQSISLAVGTAPDLDVALSAVLRAVCETTGWAAGQAWLPLADDVVLECCSAWYGPGESLGAFRHASEQMRLRRGEGLPGRVWESLKPVWVTDITATPNAPRAKEARAAGVVAAAGIPVLAEGTAVAVIEFFLLERRGEDERLLKLLAAIATQLGVGIQHKRAEQELRANAEEFRAARDIQDRLFPEAPPTIPGFDISGRSRAASAAGGDYYDFIPLLGDRWGVAVGDVTGHGIGPALLMAETRAYLRALAQAHHPVEAILTAANRVLAEDIGNERFITMVLVALDPAKRELTYVNAGHPPAYIFDRNGETRVQLGRSGVPLGIRPDKPFPTLEPVPLKSGDTILLLTDGIEEAMQGDDSMFGEERVLELVRTHLGKSAEEIVEALYSAVLDFAGDAPQLDDATAVVIRVL